MRIDGQIGAEDVKKLFLERENRAVVVASFENGRAKLAAACLIVSDHLDEHFAAARQFMRDSLASDLMVDGLTGLLCLEALQFETDAVLGQQCVHDFVLAATEGLNPPGAAFVLLNKIKRGVWPQDLKDWEDLTDGK